MTDDKKSTALVVKEQTNLKLERFMEEKLSGKSERQRKWICLCLGGGLVLIGAVDALTGWFGYIGAKEAIGLGIPMVLLGARASKKEILDAAKEAASDE